MYQAPQPQQPPPQSIAVQGQQQQPPIPKEAIHDPMGTVKALSTQPSAHVDPGPVNWTSLRPTLTGGMAKGLADGMSTVHH